MSEPSGPTMPTGMLVPPASASAAALTERLAIAFDQKGGEWVELQIAHPNDGPERRGFERWQETSCFVSPAAMAKLHDAFARASPGFDLFVPHLLDGGAVDRLRGELAAAKGRADAPLGAVVEGLLAWLEKAHSRGDQIWILP